MEASSQASVSIQENLEQLKFSSLIILFRALKTIRLQESLGKRIQQRQLFTIACMAAANQCDNNMQGKPFFVKSILKATFIAQSYLECQANEPNQTLLSLLTYEEFQMASSNPMDSLGLLSYEKWTNQNFGYYIQMFNTIVQVVDF